MIHVEEEKEKTPNNNKQTKHLKTKHTHTHTYKGGRKNSVRNTELSGRYLLNEVKKREGRGALRRLSTAVGQLDLFSVTPKKIE